MTALFPVCPVRGIQLQARDEPPGSEDARPSG